MDQARPANPKLLTIQQTAERLAVSINVLLAWKKRGILKPSVNLNGKSYYSEYQIQKFLENRPSKELVEAEQSQTSREQVEPSDQAGRALSEVVQERKDVSPMIKETGDTSDSLETQKQAQKLTLLGKILMLMEGGIYKDEFSND